MSAKFIILSICCTLLAACGDTSWHETWKSTTGTYNEYVNIPASIDYDDKGEINNAQRALAINMQIVDAELTNLERYMVNQDRPPNPESVGRILEKFKWIDGVIAMDAEGNILAKAPSTPIKELDFTPIMKNSPLGARGLRADFQPNQLGPEVLLGVPVYAGSELKGYFVAYFDMKTLLKDAPHPENILIFSSKISLWGGGESSQAALSGDWENLAKSQTSGKSNGYVWISRYFGGYPIFFASAGKIVPQSDQVQTKQVEEKIESQPKADTPAQEAASAEPKTEIN